MKNNCKFVPFAEVVRNNIVESTHLGAAHVVNAHGEVLYSLGDPDFITFPRSSLKPIQSISLVETGAFDAYKLKEKHLALSCASHIGEPFHGDLVHKWLACIGLTTEELACGRTFPRTPELAYELVRNGKKTSQIWHNCSGKHCGFLTTCLHMNWPTKGYELPVHPAQIRYLDVLSELLDDDAHKLPLGRDDCTLPSPALSVSQMAHIAARFAAAKSADTNRVNAIRLIQSAMRKYPEFVAGNNQLTVKFIEATDGRVLVKNGAEGFLIAMLPEEEIGIAMKILDGNPRARGLVMTKILIELGLMDQSRASAVEDLLEITIKDSRGKPTGILRAVENFEV